MADDDEDPLDAFMREINTEAPSHKHKPAESLACDEEVDGIDYVHASRGLKKRDRAGGGDEDQGDSDEEVYRAARLADQADGFQADPSHSFRRSNEPLPPIDHALQDYEDFEKCFYEESSEIAAMDNKEVEAYRRQLDIRVAGFDFPRPVRTFRDCGFDDDILKAISKAGYDHPTPIQCQALPAVLSGRDCLVVAKTGSGKTVAFLLPMIIHISDQREVEKGEGPVALVVAPTRELAEQIHKEARKFAKAYDYRISAAFGGLSKFDQVKALKAGCEAAICTPGRLIDLVKMKACSLGRVTFCVMDEADRMFEMGFEGQIRSILSQIRPLKQLVLFTATMPRKVEALANDALTRALRISVGIGGVANSDVTQFVEVFKQEEEKLDWLRLHIQSFVDQGEVIVFTSTHKKVDALVLMLQAMGIKAAGIHGEMDQYSRSHVLDSFRQGGTHVLIATDIASRGLDIKSLTTVISIDAAKDVETHIHRVGRTGRAGDKTGQAITLLLDPIDARFASGLAQTFVLGGVTISTSLHELTLKDNGRCNGHWGMGGGRGGGRGRGRRPTRSLGGLGLGFSAPSSSGASLGSSASVSIRQGVEFVPLPGFERSHAALGQLATTSSLPPPPALPPGPPPPPLTFPPGPPPSFFQAIQPSSMQANPAEEFLPPPPPLPPTQPQAANPVTTFQAGRFKSQFVRSGVTSVESNVEIIASRAPSSTAIPSLQESKVPPVPVPVHLQPMYLKHQTFGRYSKPSPADHDKEAQAAIEAARQIAARLGAGGGAGAVPHPPALNASDAVLRAQAAAQAIADRLAAAAQAEQR